MSITVVIPAFNEGPRIGNTVQAVSQYADEVLVIDDGSQDDTALQAEAAGAHVLHPDASMAANATSWRVFSSIAPSA